MPLNFSVGKLSSLYSWSISVHCPQEKSWIIWIAQWETWVCKVLSFWVSLSQILLSVKTDCMGVQNTNLSKTLHKVHLLFFFWLHITLYLSNHKGFLTLYSWAGICQVLLNRRYEKEARKSRHTSTEELLKTLQKRDIAKTLLNGNNPKLYDSFLCAWK